MLRNVLIHTLVLVTLLFYQKRIEGSDLTTEEKIKAVIVYKITLFITWPKGLEDITLCTQASKAFNTAMKSVAGKIKRGKAINVIIQDAGDTSLLRCNILYISQPEKITSKVLTSLKGTSILTISDRKNFAELGGIIGLFKIKDKIKFAINLTSKDQAGLEISSQLLNLAKIIP